MYAYKIPIPYPPYKASVLIIVGMMQRVGVMAVKAFKVIENNIAEKALTAVN